MRGAGRSDLSAWRPHALIWVFVGAVALFLGATSSAAAGHKARAEETKRACSLGRKHESLFQCRLEFRVPASDGYQLTVSAVIPFSLVQITVEGHSTSAQYSALGTVTTTSLEASFGRLGEVSMGFHPSGNNRFRRIPPRCESGHMSRVGSRLGSFRGSFEFNGERGYIHAVASHALGGLGNPLTNTSGTPLECKPSPSPEQQERRQGSAWLEGGPPGKKIRFSATRFFGRQPSRLSLAASAPNAKRYGFFAYALEYSGRVSIMRQALAVAGSSSFSSDDSLTNATVNPPAPFSGQGHFIRDSKGRASWTGNLRVTFPGVGLVPLTGGPASLATVADHLKQLEESFERPNRE